MAAVVKVPFFYRSDLDRAVSVIIRVADGWVKEPGAAILGTPEVHSVLQFGDARVTLLLAIKVTPRVRISAERELHCRVKLAVNRGKAGGPLRRTPGEPPDETD